MDCSPPDVRAVFSSPSTARLRKPQDGLYTGTIKALDTADSSYRVTFDRPGYGTHSIPDYEVWVGSSSQFVWSLVLV